MQWINPDTSLPQTPYPVGEEGFYSDELIVINDGKKKVATYYTDPICGGIWMDENGRSLHFVTHYLLLPKP